MASVGEDIAREILLKLPTRDLVRCSCVCKLWRGVILDPSFRTLHGKARHVVSGSGTEAETLLVRELCGHGVGLEMTVVNITTWKPMCRFTMLAAGYSPVNACNGFLLLASGVHDWPVYVCNPVTGENLKIPAPPEIKRIQRRTYAIGFSRATRRYKLFCLSFTRGAWSETHDTYLDVYTLRRDGDGGWRRRHKNLFPAVCNLHPSPPVLMNGKLYVVIERPVNNRAPDRMLVIDVASEAHGTYYLPEEFTGLDPVAVYAFLLRGRLCVAIRVIGRRRVNFWVMLSRRGQGQGQRRWRSWRMPKWERRYTFYLDADDSDYYGNKPCCAWLDSRDGMLCYRYGDCLYKYDITKKRPKKLRIQLPDDRRWNVYGCYRPSLLSPHLSSFASTSTSVLQQQRGKVEDCDCEQALVRALGCKQPSKKRFSKRKPDSSISPIRTAKRRFASQLHTIAS